jgi:HD-GYP domain-containing protein (c-di-GMP phosphodiesterase class II)
MTGSWRRWLPGRGESWPWALAALAVAAPAVLFVALLRLPDADLMFGSSSSHFYVVSVVALLAMAMAIAVIWAARRLPDARTLFLAMGFVSMAAIFVAHGLGTSPLFSHQHGAPAAAAREADEDEEYGPGAEEHAGHDMHAAAITTSGYGDYGGGYDSYGASSSGGGAAGATVAPPDKTAIARGKVVGYSAQLSLFMSAIFFALAVIDLPDRAGAFILKRWGFILQWLTIALAGHIVIALKYPQILSPVPLASDPLRYSIGAAAIAGFAFAWWRFRQAHELAVLPLQGAMALGMVLLIEAQLFMWEGRAWHISWWEYHFAMLLGFSICVGGLLRQYRLAGDLGAVVEGLFLRRQVTGIRHGDPRALAALSAAVSAKDTETDGHMDRVGDLTVKIGRRMGIATGRMDTLRRAGRLHDVGKIGVPNSILRKPGKLTPAEFEVMKAHTIRGERLAARSEFLADLAPIIRAHHEKLDGSGYPDGLKGDEIPVEARILAVSDIWDALVSDRPYRKAMAWIQAGGILAEGAGPHLDADCVEALFEILGLPDLSRFVDGNIPDLGDLGRKAA